MELFVVLMSALMQDYKGKLDEIERKSTKYPTT